MKIIRNFAFAAAAVAALSWSIPSTPVLANGVASTRNLLLLGGAAATYLVIEHNRKVHEREAEAAQRQAAAEQAGTNAWAAYQQEARAYKAAVAENGELQREVSYQHRIVEQQQRELASLGASTTTSHGDVAMVSYGWGSI
jgi:wobble nucleotide-excising tRNase